jgi:hypothetical protein
VGGDAVVINGGSHVQNGCQVGNGEVEQPRELSERSHSPCSLSLSISVCLKGRKKKIKINEGVKSAGLVCSIILTPAELLIIIPQLILIPGYNISLLLLAFAIILILNS